MWFYFMVGFISFPVSVAVLLVLFHVALKVSDFFTRLVEFFAAERV